MFDMKRAEAALQNEEQHKVCKAARRRDVVADNSDSKTITTAIAMLFCTEIAFCSPFLTSWRLPLQFLKRCDVQIWYTK